ncbi:MAG: tetratricopeptide repeat protein [Chloracidobacterium sp.]|nr:tetratricopeptide repeat protein [Chloracidobacterium sp.]
MIDPILRYGLIFILIVLAAGAHAQPPTVPSLSLSVFKAATDNYEKGNYDLAISGYSKYIAMRPNDPAAWFNRGLARYYRARKGAAELGFREAIADFSQAIKLNPKEAEYWHVRGGVYSFIMPIDFALSRDRAIADFTQAIRLRPDYAAAYRERGVVYERVNRLNEAMSDLNTAIRLEPNNAVALYTRAKVHGFRKNYAASRADLQAALRVQPGYDAAEIYLKYISEEESKARKQTTVATQPPRPRTTPTSAVVRPPAVSNAPSSGSTGTGKIKDAGDGYAQTEAAIKRKDFAAAVPIATTTMQMLPKPGTSDLVNDTMEGVRISVLLMRALAYSRTGKYNESDEDYKAAALATMDQINARLKAAVDRYGPSGSPSAGALLMATLDSKLAVTSCQTGFKGAMEWMDEVKRTRPNDSLASIKASITAMGVRESCSMAYSMNGGQLYSETSLPGGDKTAKLNESVRSYTEAIKFTPNAPKPYAGRAKAYRKLGRNDLAAADEAKARELQTKK